ncbi:hypothetical protein H6B10_17325, partial [Gemmiger formicilis]|nr:hypothetical protein [Gemmiger formicilis]
IGYQAQVIPAILAAFTLVYLEKFFRKICPAVVSMIVVPIFLVTDQQIPTGSMWKTASPISQRKLSMPAQNWLM